MWETTTHYEDEIMTNAQQSASKRTPSIESPLSGSLTANTAIINDKKRRVIETVDISEEPSEIQTKMKKLAQPNWWETTASFQESWLKTLRNNKYYSFIDPNWFSEGWERMRNFKYNFRKCWNSSLMLRIQRRVLFVAEFAMKLFLKKWLRYHNNQSQN